MRISMGIVRNQHGVFHLRKKVPKKLEEAVALVTDTTKPRVAWLKKTLNTKDHKAAKVRAAPVLMEFDRILAKAEALKRTSRGVVAMSAFDPGCVKTHRLL